jgi:hypothetical protein
MGCVSNNQIHHGAKIVPNDAEEFRSLPRVVYGGVAHKKWSQIVDYFDDPFKLYVENLRTLSLFLVSAVRRTETRSSGDDPRSLAAFNALANFCLVNIASVPVGFNKMFYLRQESDIKCAHACIQYA